MEFTIQWFFLLKTLLIAILLVATAYAYYKEKSYYPLVAMSLIVVLILSTFIKFDFTSQTNSLTTQQNKEIKRLNLQLPEKVEDNSFKERTKIQGISSEDLK